MSNTSGFVERNEIISGFNTSDVLSKEPYCYSMAHSTKFNLFNIFKIVEVTWVDFYMFKRRLKYKMVTDFLSTKQMSKLYSNGFHIKIIWKNAYTGEVLGDLEIPTYESLLLTKYKEIPGAVPLVMVFEKDQMISELFEFDI